jgi:hypothetical protein
MRIVPLLAVCATVFALVPSAPAAIGAARLPFFVAEDLPSADSGTPVPVARWVASLDRQRAIAIATAQRTKPSTALGCVDDGFGGLGAPAPAFVEAVVLGADVAVEYRYAHWPKAPACRPAELALIVVATGGSEPNTIERPGPAGRVVLPLPVGGKPPYRIEADATSWAAMRGGLVRWPVSCAAPCPDGPRPGQGHAFARTRSYPLRGVTRPELERSLRYELADLRFVQVRSVACASVARCSVTYVEPPLPTRPYTVEYPITGERTPGCWRTDWLTASSHNLPYDGAEYATPAGCVGWS